jgi:hypothetical protein
MQGYGSQVGAATSPATATAVNSQNTQQVTTPSIQQYDYAELVLKSHWV